MRDADNKNHARGVVAVGLSGGIDSAMAAWQLQEQGWQVIGLTMSIWNPRHTVESARRNACYGPGEKEDIAAAQAIANHLGIPHHTIFLADEYERWVLDEFRTQHLAGFTPNPCALCNPIMKFGFLPERARANGLEFDYFATGHYVRVTRDTTTGRHRLWRGRDTNKDQSYFVARLSQEQLAGTLFPLGDLTKAEIRETAYRIGLGSLVDKPESQDFFEGDDISVLFNGEGTRPGAIVDESGKHLGEHRGIIHYTIGQRDGLGIAVGHKVYVKQIDSQSNTLVVAPRTGVFASGCRLADMRWIAGTTPDPDLPLTVRLRYRHAGVGATLKNLPEGGAELHFEEPQFAVTPGQMAVLYSGDETLGAGWITASLDDW